MNPETMDKSQMKALGPWAKKVAFEPGEIILKSTRRHLVGLVYLYIEIAAGLAALFTLGFLLLPDGLESLSPESYTLFTLASVLVIAAAILILVLVTGIYLASRLVITNKGVIQILQNGVFQVKVSRLSKTDIEDVTSKQSGILQTIFGYGTLIIETSGEMKNFIFPYCPSPDEFAQAIARARQSTSTNNN